MPRKARMYLPGVPCHVIQRGNNRGACFYTKRDYQFYLECLNDACQRYHVAIHAYVLMTNHVHLLLTPETKEGVSQVIQSLGRRYVQYINYQYSRTGTLWEGRHKSSLIDAENYLLICYRYIELNPVRAGMVSHPAEYPWSSYHANALDIINQIVEPHPVYSGLGGDDIARQNAYKQLFESHLNIKEIHAIQEAAQFSMPLGNDRFQAQIEAALGRKLGQTKRGRPGVCEQDAQYFI